MNMTGNLRVLPLVFFLLFLAVVLSPSGSASSDATGEKSRIECIRRAIEESGASWTAGRTAVSDLSIDEKRNLTGLLFEETVSALNSPTPLPQLPSSLDWRERFGSDWMTPVRYQGICGACVSFGSIGPLESLLSIASGDPYWEPDLSEQHLFSCGGGRCNWGWNVGSSMAQLTDWGVPFEECFPYLSEDGQQRDCGLACFNADQHVTRIRNWGWVDNDVEIIKYYLQQGPLTTCMTVYEDFFYYTGGVYEHVWGDYIYGHCITLIGYDDAEQAWICKNSWGIFWGEDGFFKISYEDSDIGNNTSIMELYPVVRLMVDKEHVSPGSTLYCGVGLYNPGSVFDGEIRGVLEVPWQDEFVFLSTDLTLGAGMNYTDPFHTTLTVPDLPPGTYTMYLDLRDPDNDVSVSCDRHILIVE